VQPAEFLTPTSGERIKLVVVLLLILLWLISHAFWIPALSDRWLDTQPCNHALELKLVALYLTLLPVPAALYFGWSAYRILRSGQVPPPGSWQLVRTRIRLGWRALLDAACHAVIALGAAYSAVHIGHALNLLEVLRSSC
jgi:hypothetical protein